MATQGYSWFITGASRGIGFEMKKQLLESPASHTVVADFNAKERLHIVQMDVTDPTSIQSGADEATKIVRDLGIDYLINNAGVVRNLSIFHAPLGRKFNVNSADSDVWCWARTWDGSTPRSTWMQTPCSGYSRRTSSGPRSSQTRSFLPFLEKGRKKTIVNISSLMGSISSDVGAPHASYGIAKAGLNMLTYKMAKERSDITTISMCPGWLQTDLGGKNADHPVSVGVTGILKTVGALKPEDSGKFLNTKGEQYPW
ncbi:NAD(P)-binding protein [Lentinus tigrinus ALCF2SS1-7]|uniref:NAD(P)-binding protein n=1 Tax=Lentinus tigrinus ALCF2SS1-6 TaxID=1328759 RepID=A0A5C2RRD2_9APHY|nr:NAD(P)-binding protein [Lentinus tigrinus ALCF2SS1-6]RPD73842.1 NAD(P)-binding protein [Lentinus tigrinus ALCF2SS1-7]